MKIRNKIFMFLFVFFSMIVLFVLSFFIFINITRHIPPRITDNFRSLIQSEVISNKIKADFKNYDSFKVGISSSRVGSIGAYFYTWDELKNSIETPELYNPFEGVLEENKLFEHPENFSYANAEDIRFSLGAWGMQDGEIRDLSIWGTYKVDDVGINYYMLYDKSLEGSLDEVPVIDNYIISEESRIEMLDNGRDVKITNRVRDVEGEIQYINSIVFIYDIFHCTVDISGIDNIENIDKATEIVLSILSK